MPFTWHNPLTWTDPINLNAVKMNLELRDQLRALWIGQSVGDMEFYSSATLKERLPKGQYGQVLMMGPNGFPIWANANNLKGALNDEAYLPYLGVTQEFSLLTLEEVNGAILNLNLTATCTVFLEALVCGCNLYDGYAHNLTVEAKIDTIKENLGYNYVLNSSWPGSPMRMEELSIFYRWGSVEAGSHVLKLLCAAQLNPGGPNAKNYIYTLRMRALAFSEGFLCPD